MGAPQEESIEEQDRCRALPARVGLLSSPDSVYTLNLPVVLNWHPAPFPGVARRGQEGRPGEEGECVDLGVAVVEFSGHMVDSKISRLRKSVWS